jgi:hypothetical protein
LNIVCGALHDVQLVTQRFQRVARDDQIRLVEAVSFRSLASLEVTLPTASLAVSPWPSGFRRLGQ